MFVVSATAQLLCPPQVGSKKYFEVVHEKQHMHAWFPTVMKTQCFGYLVLYIQHVTMIAVVCPGTNVSDTVEIFKIRLANLLFRYCGEEYQITYILQQLDDLNSSRRFGRRIYGRSETIKETIKRNVIMNEANAAMSIDDMEDKIIAHCLGLEASTIFQCKPIQ